MEPNFLSVVIPAYNEEDVIGECLRRLAEQLADIDEIIVVDNNSTDGTRTLVESWVARHPEIKILDEAEQGLVHARNAGMHAATGAAIARIDADTLVPPDWARSIVEFLRADIDSEWAALCGRGKPYDLPYGEALDELTARWPFRTRREDSARVRSVPVLYGSNTVMRRETWLKVHDKLAMRRDVFEDVDMGLCVLEANGRNAFLPHLTVGVSPRRMENGVPAFVRYMSCLPRTLLLHRRFGLAAGAMFVYLPYITALHTARLGVIRAYDKESRQFTLTQFLAPRTDRVAP